MTNLWDRTDLTPQTGFLKITMYGNQGSGKTYTAAMIATGIWQQMTKDGLSPGPVAMLDSETGSSKIRRVFDTKQIPFLAIGTRSFPHLLQGFRDALDKRVCCLIVDSVTHFSDDLRITYLKDQGRKRWNPLYDSIPLNDLWGPFAELFNDTPMHAIACGRLAWDYDRETDTETGKTETVKTDARLRSLGRFGHEGDILVEMQLVQDRAEIDSIKARRRKGAHVISVVHRAIIMKDRWSCLEGKAIDNPTFKDFLPIWPLLHQSHQGVDRSPSTLAEGDGITAIEYQRRRRRSEIAIQEIDGCLATYFPGRSTGEGLAKVSIPCFVFGTNSRTKVETLPPDQLEAGAVLIRTVCGRLAEAAIDLTRESLSDWVPKMIQDIKAELVQDDTDPFYQGPVTGPPPVNGDGPVDLPETLQQQYGRLVAEVAGYPGDPAERDKVFMAAKLQHKSFPKLQLDDLLNRRKPSDLDIQLLDALARGLRQTVEA